VVGCFKHGNETAGFIKGEEFFDLFSNNCILDKNHVERS
jgi:hypothetical protein